LAEEALPQLIAALRDEAWTVRLYAAFALLNIKHSGAAQALAAAATGDADARVRQTAFLALAETPGSFAPEALKKAAADVRDDVSMYAAYALARRGDDSEVGRILARARHEDKAVRFTAAWLLGQLGRKTPPEASDVLAGRVKDEAERPNIRHVSVSSLLELAQARPEAVKDEAVLSLLVTAGPQNFALTRTITKFFKAAAASKPLRTRMRAEPLKSALTEFVDTYKGSVKKPGALGELVQLLADILGLPLDMPTPVPDPSGAGVPGVDPNLGPVHLILEPPEPASGKPRAIQSFADLRGAAPEAAFAAVSGSGLEADLLSRHSVEPQAAMPLSQALWVRVPDPKVLAFQSELEARGWRVRRAKPMYPLINDTGKASGAIEVRERTGLTGKGVLVAYVDEGGDTRHPAIAPERIKYRFNFSDEGGPNDVESESVGHATHGMGIVGAQSVDGSPYVGMAPGVDFAIVKVLGANGGSEAAVMAGLEAVADVVKDPLETPAMANLSLGGPGDADGPLGRLVNKLVLKDISVNAAAGNEGPMPGTVGTPANAALATSVAAVDKKGRLTSYSSRGRPGKGEISWADFGGGVFFDKRNPYEIVSALSTGLAEAARDAATTLLWKGKALYQYMSGTSMAAPHTSGRKAVLIERLRAAGRLPKGYALWLDGLMERTAKRMEGKAENEVGAGLVDEAAALAALDEALKDPAKLSAEANALWEEANRLHGSAKPLAPSTTPGWFHPLAWL
ncbi:MAG TPA: S8 family serine peptidase, partial [Elusimicrobiota bacterium]|nr:S8 family serine peptidase [Elusimicrobiota bacterium]